MAREPSAQSRPTMLPYLSRRYSGLFIDEFSIQIERAVLAKPDCGYSHSSKMLQSLRKNAIDAGASDLQFDGDIRWPDALCLELDDFIRLSASSRHAALIASLCLGPGDAFALAFEHGLALSLANSADHGQHQAPSSRGRVHRLVARH